MGDDSQVVFVVGAGASKEFGLPVGRELAEKIAEITNLQADMLGNIKFAHDREFLDRLQRLSRYLRPTERSPSSIYQYARYMHESLCLAPSIDNYLHTHKDKSDLVAVGKLAISHALELAERQSKLFVDDGNVYNKLNFERMGPNWLLELFHLLVAQRQFDDFLTSLKRIRFVSFNYDRCIHQFIVIAAKRYFILTSSQAAELIAVLDEIVIYPYGSLGGLTLHMEEITSFGRSSGDVQGVLSRIKTFTEGVDSDQTTNRINEALDNCSAIVFLGFSFLPLNMKILTKHENFREIKVLATVKGVSSNSQKHLNSELWRIYGAAIFSPDDEQLYGPEAIELFDGTCSAFFHEYQRFLIQYLAL